MTDNTVTIIAIELLAAAQGCHFHEPLNTSVPLRAVIDCLRREVPQLEGDVYFYPFLQSGIALVRSGAVLEAVGATEVPEICDRPVRKS